jgi:hypothetical protein
VAPRTDKASIEVPREVRDALKDYIHALEATLGRHATHGEVISAFLQGVPLWQANAMLDAYRPSVNTGSSPGSTGD